MKFDQAVELLRAELAANSAVGKALTTILTTKETAHYRESARSADPTYVTRCVGRGEGVYSILTTIAPVQDATFQASLSKTAAGAPK